GAGGAQGRAPPVPAARRPGGPHRGDAERAPGHPEPTLRRRVLVPRGGPPSGPGPPVTDARRRRTFLALAIALPVVMTLGVSMGSVSLPPLGVARSLLAAVGVPLGGSAPLPASSEAILWSVRLPRVLLAALVGGGLAVV